MIKIFRTIKQAIEGDDQTPGVGDVYVMRDDNPWDPIKTKVTGIKEGWVRYTFVPGYSPNYKPISDFLRMYRRLA